MPITQLLKDKRTPKEIERLNEAFNHALSLLGVIDRNDPFCDMVARDVLEGGATGISEPREIAKIAAVILEDLDDLPARTLATFASSHRWFSAV